MQGAGEILTDVSAQLSITQQLRGPGQQALPLTFQHSEHRVVAVALAGSVARHAVVSPSIALLHVHDLEDTVWKSYKPERTKGNA